MGSLTPVSSLEPPYRKTANIYVLCSMMAVYIHVEWETVIVLAVAGPAEIEW